MDGQQKNLISAIVLSFLVITIWSIFFPPEERESAAIEQAAVSQTAGDGADAQPSQAEQALQNAALKLAQSPRVKIETPELSGTLSLLGGRIDDLSLTQYRDTTDQDSEQVKLLIPQGQSQAYYAAFGWVAGDGVSPQDVPGPNTLWSLEDGDVLTPTSPVTLRWDNGSGLIFKNVISVDERFMFSFEQSVQSESEARALLHPYGLLRRHGEPEDLKNFFILHEGLVRMIDGELSEVGYDDMQDYEVDALERTRAERVGALEGGWIGYTDHYWMTTLIPEQDQAFRATTKYFENRDLYQAEIVQPSIEVGPGQTQKVVMRLFAGAKEWEDLNAYESEGVGGFVDSIDWGWFVFLTKPIFWLLHTFNAYIGNMGWSIIALTLVIKALVLPLAYKSYVSMAKMKELQPEMEALKEKAGDDRQVLQQGMMKLYRDNKVNPASGCLPILLQVPIFFSLYKVIFVTIELRHAPWFGWINDLSAPDPSSFLNLFGLLPFAGPDVGSILALIGIGILPILLGISMWLQQKLNPSPTDATQKMIFAWMPWVFMFMLGSFASGLVIYWIANNMITFTQQYFIMRKHGAKPDILGNITSGLKRKKKDAK